MCMLFLFERGTIYSSFHISLCHLSSKYLVGEKIWYFLFSGAYHCNFSTHFYCVMTQYFYDEYNLLDSSGETYLTDNFTLECGQVLQEAQVWHRFRDHVLFDHFYHFEEGSLQCIRETEQREIKLHSCLPRSDWKFKIRPVVGINAGAWKGF